MRTIGVLCAVMALCSSTADAARERDTTIYDYCTPGPFVLTFTDGAAGLGKLNTAILDNLLSQSSYCGKFMTVDGYPTVGGSKIGGYKRSMLALQYLVEHGTSSTDIYLRLHDRRRASGPQDHRRDVAITFVEGISTRDGS
jgi:hypothetical protein